MPGFKLNVNKVLATRSGHAIRFVKGEVVQVPEYCRNEALAIGAVPSEELPEFVPAANPEPADLTRRRKLILDTFSKMVERDSRGDFTANGVPSMGVLNELLGFRIDAAERDSLWLEHQNAED